MGGLLINVLHVGAVGTVSYLVPGIYQGTHIDTKHKDINRLIENVRNKSITYTAQQNQLELLRKLNNRFNSKRKGDQELSARVQSFELAYKMQMEATSLTRPATQMTVLTRG